MTGHGQRIDKNGVAVPRARCVPADPSIKPHVFTIRTKTVEATLAPSRVEPPPCPRHPETSLSRIRYGTYRKGSATRRQMYECRFVDLETGEIQTHTYTPPLPRDHVHPDNDNAHCDECEELRGIHNGETAVARRHGWSTRIVARALDKLAHGASYASVSQWAVETTGQQRTRARPGADGVKTDAELDAELAQRAKERRKAKQAQRKRQTSVAPATGDEEDPFLATAVPTDGTSTTAGQPGEGDGGSPSVVGDEAADADGVAHISEASRRARNLWHIAADWTEAFAPVIYEPINERLTAQALAERARLDAAIIARNNAKTARERRAPLDRPQVIFIDDVPVYGQDPKTGTRSRRDAGYFVLVVAELHWVPKPAVSMGKKSTKRSAAEQSSQDGEDTTWTTVTRLRLLRVMAKSNTPAWRLVFDELGYTPDFVVADAGTGLKAG